MRIKQTQKQKQKHKQKGKTNTWDQKFNENLHIQIRTAWSRPYTYIQSYIYIIKLKHLPTLWMQINSVRIKTRRPYVYGQNYSKKRGIKLVTID